jgi:hypothetical protein
MTTPSLRRGILGLAFMCLSYPRITLPPLGSVHAPMSAADHAAKFAYLTEGLLTPERAAEVRALVARLEEVADVSTLADLLP